jgi:hypothetical protein
LIGSTASRKAWTGIQLTRGDQKPCRQQAAGREFSEVERHKKNSRGRTGSMHPRLSFKDACLAYSLRRAFMGSTFVARRAGR